MKQRNQILSALLAFAMAMNLALVPAYAADSTSYQDGTYTGTSTVQPDEDEDFDPYDIKVDVEIKDGAITAVSYADDNDFDGNDSYATKAMNGTKKITGVADQILAAQGTTGVDTVSGATCTSNAILTAVDAALEKAKSNDDGGEEEPETEPFYVLMNIPYADFYRAELNNNVAVDSVSSATLNKTRTGTLVGGSYHVNTDGSDITGITFPVQVSSFADLEGLTQITDESSVTIQVTNRGTTTETTYTGADALFESASYSYYILSEKPDSYKVMTVAENGSKSFGAIVGDVTEIEATATITTNTNYGDYQVDVEDLPSSINKVYAVVLSTDEADYGLRHLENVWRTSELAWCTGYTTSVHGSPTSSSHYVEMMGQTIKQITYITDAGIFRFACDLYVTPYYNGEVTMTATDANTVSVSGLPENIQNPVASVSYTVGSGRDSQTVYLAQDVAVVGGKIALNTAMEADKTYNVTIVSDNYAQITGTVTLSEATDPDEGEEEASEYTYLYAALTWEEYWASEGVYAAGSDASSDELDSKGESDKGAFDVVSRATTNHGLHRGSFQSVAVIHDTEGKTYTISHWTDSDTAVLTDGRTLTKSSDRSTGITTLMLSNGTVAIMDYYEVTGIKYVPVQVATEDLDAFCQQYAVVKNGETLSGGYSEQNLTAYTATAAVDETTNGLKVATKNADGTFTFAARTTGTGSGLAETQQKTVDPDSITVTVKDANGAYGEFLRVDLTGTGYGDLGSNLYAVVWTYYGDDATYTNALETYGTKFAADNWMHKSMGIQLGLTDSLRCQLPAGTDGTGYWTITVCAMGYADATFRFQATEDNIVKTEDEEQVDTSVLEALVAQAQALKESDYTADSWSNLAVELSESIEMLSSNSLTQAMVDEQVKHLSDALAQLVKVEDADNSDDGDGDEDNAPTEPGDADNGDTKPDDSKPGATDPGSSNTGDTNTEETKPSDTNPGNSNTGDASQTDSGKGDNNAATSDQSTTSTGTTVVKTADESHIFLWLGALVLSCMGFVATVMISRKKQH